MLTQMLCAVIGIDGRRSELPQGVAELHSPEQLRADAHPDTQQHRITADTCSGSPRAATTSRRHADEDYDRVRAVSPLHRAKPWVPYTATWSATGGSPSDSL
jgi:hypothetical protein